ncbi:zinc finger protein [Rhizoctonia solani]|uniref:Zinc finger protein n=1 Tax=Rhizoctonia solani TaxID=456999 RepID=A0A8H7I471_9AGAM|nr:zinc finger protein [Rhizoctonia solani]
MLASSSLHHFSTREPSHIAHERSYSNSQLSSNLNLNLALCSSRPSTDAVPRPYLELAPSRYHPAPAPLAPTRGLSGLPDAHAPSGGTKLPLDPPEDDPATRRGSITRPYSQSYPPQHSQHRAHHSEAFVPTHSPVPAPVSASILFATTAKTRKEVKSSSQGVFTPAISPSVDCTGNYDQPSLASLLRITQTTDGFQSHLRGLMNPYTPMGATPPSTLPAWPSPSHTSDDGSHSGQLAPYDYPVDSSWSGRRPSTEQSPVPTQRQDLGTPSSTTHPPWVTRESSSGSTGMPASPDQFAVQPNGLVVPEGAIPPSATNPGQRQYAFVSLAGSTIRKRPRRRYDEIERLYSCSFEDCTKAYGTLNHLNAHVTMQKHGPKRNPSEFKELRKLWRTQKKAEQVASRSRSRRRPEDGHHAMPGQYGSSGYGSDESEEGGTPQPSDSNPYHQGQVDPMWPHIGHEMGDRYSGHPGMPGYGHDSHGQGMGVVMAAEEGVMDRIPPDATLLRGLPPTHPSQQPYSNSMHHSMPSYGGMPAMPMSTGPSLMRRGSEQDYDYPHGPPGPHGPSGPHDGYAR